jgi:hypothetical protein
LIINILNQNFGSKFFNFCEKYFPKNTIRKSAFFCLNTEKCNPGDKKKIKKAGRDVFFDVAARFEKATAPVA